MGGDEGEEVDPMEVDDPVHAQEDEMDVEEEAKNGGVDLDDIEVEDRFEGMSRSGIKGFGAP